MHGQDHSGDLLVKPCGELSDCHEFVFKLSLGGEVFELINEVLESIIWGSIFVLSGFLDEFGQVTSCLYFGIKGIEVLIIVFDKLCEGFVFGFDCSVSQLVVPLLGEGDPFPSSYFTENKGKLEFI